MYEHKNKYFASPITSSYINLCRLLYLFCMIGAAEMSEADMRRLVNHTIKDENAAVRFSCFCFLEL